MDKTCTKNNWCGLHIPFHSKSLYHPDVLSIPKTGASDFLYQSVRVHRNCHISSSELNAIHSKNKHQDIGICCISGVQNLEKSQGPNIRGKIFWSSTCFWKLPVRCPKKVVMDEWISTTCGPNLWIVGMRRYEHIEVAWCIIYNVHVGHHVWGRLMSRGLDLTSSIGLQSCDRYQGLTSTGFTLWSPRGILKICHK